MIYRRRLSDHYDVASASDVAITYWLWQLLWLAVCDRIEFKLQAVDHRLPVSPWHGFLLSGLRSVMCVWRRFVQTTAIVVDGCADRDSCRWFDVWHWATEHSVLLPLTSGTVCGRASITPAPYPHMFCRHYWKQFFLTVQTACYDRYCVLYIALSLYFKIVMWSYTPAMMLL
jgi:hypothetical protein